MDPDPEPEPEDELYGDLSCIDDYTDHLTKLENKVKVFEKRVQQLETALCNSELEKKNILISNEKDRKILKSSNENLKVNISSLFKTTKEEIKRKDVTIRDLRQQLDDLIFRKNQKLWPPRNEVVQSLNEDDAICAKPVTEDSARPNSKNHEYSNRERRSTSDDKSPSFVRLGAKHFEYRERDKRDDSNRIKYVENTALEGRLNNLNDIKYVNNSLGPCVGRDEHYAQKNSPDLYHYRRGDRKIRNEDSSKRESSDQERRNRVDPKLKEKQRYLPYDHRKDGYDRSRHKFYRHDRAYKCEDHSKTRPKRSSTDRNQNRHELDDSYRTSKDCFRRQEVEYSGRKGHDDRKRDEHVHSNRTVMDSLRKEPDFVLRKSVDDRIREQAVHSSHSVIDDRQAILENGTCKPNENATRKISGDHGAIADSGGRKSLEDRSREEHARVLHDRRTDLEVLDQKSSEECKKPETVYSRRMRPLNRHFIADSSQKKPVDEQRREESCHILGNTVEDRLRTHMIHQKSLVEERHRSLNRGMNDEHVHDSSNNSEKNVGDAANNDELDNFIANLNHKYSNIDEVEETEYENKRQHGSGDSVRPNNQDQIMKWKHAFTTSPRISHGWSKPLRPTPAIEVRADAPKPPSPHDANCNQATQLPAPPNRNQVTQPLARQESHPKKTETLSPRLPVPTEAVPAMEVSVKEKVHRHKHSNSMKNEHRKKSRTPSKVAICKTEKALDSQLEKASSPEIERPSSSSGEIYTKKAKFHSSPFEVPAKSADYDASSQLLRGSPPELHLQSTLTCQNSPSNPIDVLEILARYGECATPFKVLHGLKFCSPIADTPDNLKALFNNPLVKVSPIPMLNERRGLDVFNSPLKETATPSEEEVVGEKDETGESDSSFAIVSGSESTNAEHGVFRRKRRVTLVTKVKKAKS